MKTPRFMGFNARPGGLAPLLAAVPFVLVVTAYLWGSGERLALNPHDKLMPSLASMVEATWQALAVVDRHTGTFLLPEDWLASMGRLAAGVGLAAATGLLLGMNAGLYPGFRTLAGPFVTVASIVPPLALLPILFVTFGTDEAGKIALIYLGVVWTVSRDIERHVASFAGNQVVKGLTLGGTPSRIAYGIILPQVWPRLIGSVRQNLGTAWLFLIAAEAIASESGLGYRIFLVRRYMAMDVIIPYAMVITLTGYGLDAALRALSRRLFPWYAATTGER